MKNCGTVVSGSAKSSESSAVLGLEAAACARDGARTSRNAARSTPSFLSRSAVTRRSSRVALGTALTAIASPGVRSEVGRRGAGRRATTAGQPIHQPRVAVEAEDDRFILGEQDVEDRSPRSCGWSLHDCLHREAVRLDIRGIAAAILEVLEPPHDDRRVVEVDLIRFLRTVSAVSHAHRTCKESAYARSTVVADAASFATAAQPSSAFCFDAYISLVPIVSPFAATRVKYGLPSFDMWCLKRSGVPAFAFTDAMPSSAFCFDA